VLGHADVSKSQAPRSQSLNLGKLESDRYRLSIESLEHPEVRDSRLRREEADAEHQRHKEVLILWAILIIVGVVSVICLWIVLIPGYPAENVKWATTLLTMIVSGGLGYMTGRNSKAGA
jgi:hypothetical protein